MKQNSTCHSPNETFYANYTECIKLYTVIMDHMITNKLDQICFYNLFIMMFALCIYQFQKIYHYSKKHNQLIYLQFQILFLFLSLIRIAQTIYGVIGYQIDQRPQGWNIKDNLYLYYCDPIFILDGDKCFVRYEIQGLFTDISILLTNYVIQNISLFWYNQISPKSILIVISIFNYSSDSLPVKIIFVIFLIMDIGLLVLTIIACSLSYSETILTSLQVYQIVATFITFAFFSFSFWRAYKIKYHQKQDVIIVAILLFVVILRIAYLLFRIFDIDEIQIVQYYQKSLQQSLLFFLMNTICEFAFRLCLVKLF